MGYQSLRFYLLVLMVAFFACYWGIDTYLAATRSGTEPQEIHCAELADWDEQANPYITITSYYARLEGSVGYERGSMTWVPLTPGYDTSGSAVVALAICQTEEQAEDLPSRLTGMLHTHGVSGTDMRSVLEEVNPGIDSDNVWFFRVGATPDPPIMGVIILLFGIALICGLTILFLPTELYAPRDIGLGQTIGLVMVAGGLLPCTFLVVLLLQGGQAFPGGQSATLGVAIGLMLCAVVVSMGGKLMYRKPLGEPTVMPPSMES